MKSIGARVVQDPYVRRVQPGRDGSQIRVDEGRSGPPSITLLLAALFAFYGVFNLHEGYWMYTEGFSSEGVELSTFELNYEISLFGVLVVLFPLQGALSVIASLVLLFIPKKLVPCSLVAAVGGLVCVGVNGLSSLQYSSSAFTIAFYLITCVALLMEPVRAFLKGELLDGFEKAGLKSEE